MSNAKKPTGRPYALDRYRSEVKGEPFVLWLDESESLEVPRPTGSQMLAAEEATTSKRAVLALCGPEKGGELLDVIGAEDAAVMEAVLSDMREHFGLGN